MIDTVTITCPIAWTKGNYWLVQCIKPKKSKGAEWNRHRFKVDAPTKLDNYTTFYKWGCSEFKEWGVVILAKEKVTKDDPLMMEQRNHKEEHWGEWLKMKINLSRLQTANAHTFHSFVGDDIERLKRNFDLIINEIFKDVPYGMRPTWGKWNLSRIDYTVDVKTEHVGLYLDMLRKALILPPHTKYKPYEGSVYLYNGSTTWNIYDKQHCINDKRIKLERDFEKAEKGEDIDNNADIDEIYRKIMAYDVQHDSAENILRVEIQNKRDRVKRMKKKYDLGNYRWEQWLSIEKAWDSLRDYIWKIEIPATHHRKREALMLIDQSHKHEKTKQVMKDIILEVNKKNGKSIRTIKKNMGDAEFKKYKKHFIEVDVNPVCLPTKSFRQGDTLPCLYDLVCKELEQEHIADFNEQFINEVQIEVNGSGIKIHRSPYNEKMGW